MVRLGSLVELNPRTPKPGGPLSVITLADIDTFVGQALPRPLKGESSSRRVAQSGDVLFACISPSMENGKVAIVPELESSGALVSGELLVLRPRPGTDPQMVWAFLRQRRVREELANLMTGSSGRRRLHAQHLTDLELPIPSADVWVKAKRCLRHLDEARMLRKEQRKLAGALPSAAAALLARGKRRVPLGSLSLRLQSGIREPSTDRGTLSVLRASNIATGRIDASNLRFVASSLRDDSKLMEEGDLLIVAHSSSRDRLGRSAVYEGAPRHCTFASQLIRIRPHGLEPDFLWAWLQVAEVRATLLGGTPRSGGHLRLGVRDLEDIPVPSLSRAEQTRLAALARATRRLWGLEAEQQQCLDQLVEAHLAETFGDHEGGPRGEDVWAQSDEAGGGILDSEYLSSVRDVASERQRELWMEIVRRREAFRLGDLAASWSDYAELQHSFALFEHLGLVVRERDGDSYRWRAPDPEWEVLG